MRAKASSRVAGRDCEACKQVVRSGFCPLPLERHGDSLVLRVQLVSWPQIRDVSSAISQPTPEIFLPSSMRWTLRRYSGEHSTTTFKRDDRQRVRASGEHRQTSRRRRSLRFSRSANLGDPRFPRNSSGSTGRPAAPRPAARRTSARTVAPGILRKRLAGHAPDHVALLREPLPPSLLLVLRQRTHLSMAFSNN